MKACGLLVAAAAGALGFAALSARGSAPTDVYLTLTLQVDTVAQTWQAFGQVTGDTTQTSGLAGLEFDVTGAGGVQIGTNGVDTTNNDMPVGETGSLPVGFYDVNSSGTSGAGITGCQFTFQYKTNGTQTNILTGVGILGQTQAGVTWGTPVLLADGTYTGTSGSLMISGAPAVTTFLPATLPTPGPGAYIRTFSPGAVNTQTVQISNPSITSTGIAWTGASSGSWDMADANWSTTSVGSPFNAAWANNANRYAPNMAIFNALAGSGTTTVTVNGNIDVGSITYGRYGSWTLAAGTGVLAYGSTGAINIVIPSLGFDGSGPDQETINATIADGSTFGAAGGVTSLLKSGLGTLILGGANTYTGGTTVSAGALVANNVSGSATGTANVIMNAGTLGGSGTIAGTVQGAPGSAPWTVHPGETLAATKSATLTLGGLTTSANTTLNFNLITPGTAHSGAGSVNDMLITGNNGLTLNGGTVEFTNHSVGAASLGYYRIMQYSGSIQGAGLSSLTLPAVGNNIAYTLDTTHDPGFVDVHRGLLGDANDDGVVDSADSAILSGNMGALGAGWSGGDFNNDGVTNFADFTILSNNFGETLGAKDVVTRAAPASEVPASPSLIPLPRIPLTIPVNLVGTEGGAVSGVPEPGSLVLLSVGFLGVLGGRRARRRGGLVALR